MLVLVVAAVVVGVVVLQGALCFLADKSGSSHKFLNSLNPKNP